jgi:hypothetical protein
MFICWVIIRIPAAVTVASKSPVIDRKPDEVAMPRIIGGTSSPDTLFGDTNGIILSGDGGAQTINGLGGNYYGDAYALYNTTHGGNDILNGGSGNDTPLAQGGNDVLTDTNPTTPPS